MSRYLDAHARRAWSLGNYSLITPHFLPMAGQLVESARITSEDGPLDLACGSRMAITCAQPGQNPGGVVPHRLGG